MHDPDGGHGGRPTLPDGASISELVEVRGVACPVLVVLTGPQVGQRIRLEAAATVGRDPEADLMLSGEGVAWHHVRLEQEGEGWRLRSLDAAHPTRVDGVQVLEQPLSPDARITIGDTVLRFEVHGPVEQAFDEAVLERLNIDELTGLRSRRAFDLETTHALEAASARAEPLALIVLDIDGLKAVNDRLGHLAGAAVIRAVGAIIAAQRGSRDIAGRLGGDEMAIALPGRGRDDAFRFAEALRAAVHATPVAYEQAQLEVRISAGVALHPEHGATRRELVEAADRALYAAKSAGGDRVEIACSR